MGLTAAIITFNEEDNIQRCIEALQPICEEIIVLDSMSTDKTPQICAQLGVTFIQQPWMGYSQSKNYLNSFVKTDYIFSVDADEVVSKELQESILQLKKDGLKEVYSVNRLTNYLGTWIYHSGWYPDIKTRIFPKEGSSWEGEFVHETLATPTSKNNILLKGHLEHYSYKSFEDHRQRADKYSALTAKKFHAQGKKASILKPYLSAIGRFVAMYIIKKGFLDGKMGFKIAQISAQSNIFKYNELRRLNRESH